MVTHPSILLIEDNPDKCERLDLEHKRLMVEAQLMIERTLK
jgi:hypothetical protein